MKFKALAIIPHTGDIEIKPIVLCKECRWYTKTDNGGACKRHSIYFGKQGLGLAVDKLAIAHDGDWFCADGEKRKTRLYQYGTITWEGEDDG